MIRRKVYPDIKIDYIPYDQAYEAGFEDMRRRIPVVCRIKELIGYEPKIQTEEIIDRVIDSIKSEG